MNKKVYSEEEYERPLNLKEMKNEIQDIFHNENGFITDKHFIIGSTNMNHFLKTYSRKLKKNRGLV